MEHRCCYNLIAGGRLCAHTEAPDGPPLPAYAALAAGNTGALDDAAEAFEAAYKLGVSDRRQLEGIIRQTPAPARVRRAGA